MVEFKFNNLPTPQEGIFVRIDFEEDELIGIEQKYGDALEELARGQKEAALYLIREAFCDAEGNPIKVPEKLSLLQAIDVLKTYRVGINNMGKDIAALVDKPMPTS